MESTDRVFAFTDDRETLFLIYSPADGRVVPFDKRWIFNGDTKKPTFTPSMLVHPDNCGHGRNHFFLKGGRIEYLADCEHGMAGQTIDAPMLSEWPKDAQIWLE